MYRMCREIKMHFQNRNVNPKTNNFDALTTVTQSLLYLVLSMSYEFYL